MWLILDLARNGFPDSENENTIALVYPSTFLQLVNSSKNSILNWLLKLNLFNYFFCMFRKTLDRYFILLYHCCYPHKRKQTGLTYRFIILEKNLCSCIQKIKKKHGSADFFFLISVYDTHSLVERLNQVKSSVTCYQRQKPWE